MHPRVHETYQELAEKYQMQGPFLEVGAGNDQNAILAGSYFRAKPERFAINLSDMQVAEEPDAENIRFMRCNSNNMRDAFGDGQFGTVLCNAMIEHDKYFWRSLDEMKRVLAPGGILAIGAPGYVARRHLPEDMAPENLPKATITFDVHSQPDYWRFSRAAFKEVICEGLEMLELCVLMRVPILLAVARKPLTGLLPPVEQVGRSREQQEEDEVRWQTRRAERKKKPQSGETLSAEALEARRQRQARRKEERAERKAKPEGEGGETAAAKRERLRAERLKQREEKPRKHKTTE